jgi:hypothetical protein
MSFIASTWIGSPAVLTAFHTPSSGGRVVRARHVATNIQAALHIIIGMKMAKGWSKANSGIDNIKRDSVCAHGHERGAQRRRCVARVIHIQSEIGKGTSFRIELPASLLVEALAYGYRRLSEGPRCYRCRTPCSSSRSCSSCRPCSSLRFAVQSASHEEGEQDCQKLYSATHCGLLEYFPQQLTMLLNCNVLEADFEGVSGFHLSICRHNLDVAAD